MRGHSMLVWASQPEPGLVLSVDWSKGGCVSERTNCGWVHSLLGEHEDQTQTRHSRCVPLSYAKKGGCDMVLFTLPCLGTGAERI